MAFLSKTLGVKPWQILALVLISGYASGAMIATLDTVFGS
jgi:hypothetical protein